MVDKLAYQINDFSRCIGVGRTQIYNMIKNGDLRAIHVGGRTLIPASEAVRLIEGGAQ